MQKELIVVALTALALGACERHLDTSKAVAPTKMAAAGSAGNLVGTPPASPANPDAVETTPVDPSKPLTETPQTTSTAQQERTSP